MSAFLEEVQGRLLQDCFSDVELAVLLSGTEQRRYALVKRSLARGEILQIRRGLYCFAAPYRKRSLSLFSIAQKVYGPSYISLESALSHHGWIPEAVFAVTSVSSQRSREFKTPLGVFGFVRVPAEPFYAGVERQSDENYFIAGPWRALADYVYVYKKDWKGLHPVRESLRIEEEHLETADVRELEEIAEAFLSRRVRRFLKGVVKEMK